MTYNSKQTSVSDAQPFELYEFVRGTWTDYLTTRDTELVKDATVTYRPSSIKRSKMRQSEDTLKDPIELTLPRGDSMASDFINFAPQEVTSVTVKRLHHGLDISEARVIWKGRVAGSNVSEETVTLSCESIFTSIKRLGLRERTEWICQNTLYSAECGANQPAYRVDDTIGAVSGTQLSMNTIGGGYADGWFTGGIVEYNSIRRFIISHVGGDLVMSRPFSQLQAGIQVALYPGCDHMMSTCTNKFNNIKRYKGFPWIPGRNPFIKSII